MLDCSIGNSKSQLHKARLKLRDALRILSPAGGPAMKDKDPDKMKKTPMIDELRGLPGAIAGTDRLRRRPRVFHPHIQRCELCRALLADLETIAEAARRLFPIEEPPDELVEADRSGNQEARKATAPIRLTSRCAFNHQRRDCHAVSLLSHSSGFWPIHPSSNIASKPSADSSLGAEGTGICAGSGRPSVEWIGNPEPLPDRRIMKDIQGKDGEETQEERTILKLFAYLRRLMKKS